MSEANNNSAPKAQKNKRTYTRKTLKVLFALSGNQCAYPDCLNQVIISSTIQSDNHVSNQICHIYALSSDGPRGKVSLTEKELNAPENLILFCPTHHGIVDGQHESFPANLLQQWKQRHETNVNRRISADMETKPSAASSPAYFPTGLIDQQIAEKVDFLKKSRFHVEFDVVRFSTALGKRIAEGDLSGGTNDERSRALAWCARFLTRNGELETSTNFLKTAKHLGNSPEIDIADAFTASQEDNMEAALKILSKIDSAISRSASFMIVVHHEGAAKAIAWLDAVKMGFKDLDPDGKVSLWTNQFGLFNWDATATFLKDTTPEDVNQSPVLNHLIAMTHLVSTVPEEYRPVIISQLPLESSQFPLASNSPALLSRRSAREYFIKAAEAAAKLGLHNTEAVENDYALWLDLRDPTNSNNGMRQLESLLRDSKTALRLIPLGLQFGAKIDLPAVAQEIDRQAALNGGITPDGAMARFALAFTQKTPEKVADYISRHYDDLVKYLDKKAIRILQIEMIARAGLIQKARELLIHLLLEEDCSNVEEGRLQRMIAEAEGTDPLEARKSQFRQTGSITDLAILVNELGIREKWSQLCEYSRILFEATGSLGDAERLVDALNREKQTAELVTFFESHSDLLPQSQTLHMTYCWALFHEGKLLEARNEMAKVRHAEANANHRALTVNLAIASGDWHSLATLLATEAKEAEDRSATELMRSAQLALHLSSPHAKELLFAAVHKGDDDPNILANAYFLATSAGWESDPRVGQWLQSAADLSGDNGPVQKMTLSDIIARKPDWDRRESETWELLSKGAIPLFLAATHLNKSLVSLMLFPAIANLTPADPRRRSAIPSFSGKHEQKPAITAKTVGIDATTLLALSYLNILDKALNYFDLAYIPHSTMVWLLEEKQKSTFHQPTRIKEAHRLRHLFATEALEKFVPHTFGESELTTQVGETLATMIAEAEYQHHDPLQRIVVRPSPVHRIGSLMEEEADLGMHIGVMSSCLNIVEKLRQKGQITAEEEKRARAYLSIHEKPWGDGLEITDGAILYLDDLSTSYFLHLGILEKLKPAGFRPFASAKEFMESNELISYESISGEIIELIEMIRSSVSARIDSGRMKVDRYRELDRNENHPILDHPSANMISLAAVCDAVISDDRFLNQHTHIDNQNVKVPIFSTLNLLDLLESSESISAAERLEYRTLLRRGGFFLLPVDETELSYHLKASQVRENKLAETAELKAIRESILRVRMTSWLQIPEEAPWLNSIINVFIAVLKNLWATGGDIDDITIRSDWIAEQIDPRGWSHRFPQGDKNDMLKQSIIDQILVMITPPQGASKDHRDAYLAWSEKRFLIPVQKHDRKLYLFIVEWKKRQIHEIANTSFTTAISKNE
ncbi:MAG: HNH endonuclease [Verrucomicrobiota bacterium]